MIGAINMRITLMNASPSGCMRTPRLGSSLPRTIPTIIAASTYVQSCAYQRFGRLFSGERWERLAAAGAVVQRPLWASTGTKNPQYSDTLYVDNLVGPHTVNTMPMATLLAVADHSEPVADSASIDPGPALEALKEVGIDLGEVRMRNASSPQNRVK